ncbi:hypothetical protein Bca101_032088 [Brassica carinata]
MLSLLCFYQHWNSTLQIPYTKVFSILLPPHQLEKIRDVPSHSSNSSRFKLPVANLPPSTSPGWVEITHRRFREMGRDRDDSPPEKAKGDVEDKDYRRKLSRSRIEKKSVEEEEDVSRRESRRKSKDGRDSDSGSGLESGSDSESEKEERRRSRKSRGKKKSDRRSRSRRSRRRHDDSSSSSESESQSEYSSDYSDSESESESEDERRRRKRREREERDRKRRRREKEKKKRRKEKGVDGDSKKKKKKRKKEKKSEKAKKGAVTESWGKYGVIRETDMWNKRPEFTAWLLEVKEVNLESLPPWEEKKMFKEYYDIDGYYRRKLEKEMKKGLKKAGKSERTVFNDEEQRRYTKDSHFTSADIEMLWMGCLKRHVCVLVFRLEMQEAREKQKEEEVLALKRSMEGGMAQAMKEQARLKEEMVYLYKIGDMEGAAAIQRRLDPDVPM